MEVPGGYIKLYRKIRDHWIWEESVYLKWWLDILLTANHQTAKILINGQVKIIEPGEFHTSETKLAKRWFADRKTVDKFLKLLEKDSMISVEKSRKNGTTVKVLNYKDYQAFYEPCVDNRMDNGMDKTLDITFPKHSHKQEPKEPEEPKEVKIKEKREKKKTPTPIPFDALLANESKSFKGSVLEFTEHRESLKKPFASEMQFQKWLSKLKKMGDEQTQIAIIEQSIINGWQGIFELKTDFGGNKMQRNGANGYSDTPGKYPGTSGGHEETHIQRGDKPRLGKTF